MSRKKRNRARTSKKKRDHFSSFDLRRLAYWWQLILVAAVPFVLVPSLSNYIDLPRGILIQVAAVSILLLWLIGSLWQKKLEIVRTPFDLPLLGFVLWAGLSLLWAPNVYEGFEIWIQWSACLIFFFLTVNLVSTERDTRRLLGVLVLAGGFVAALGILQYLSEVDWILQLYPPAATFGNKNMAAQFMVVTIPLAAAFFLIARKRTHGLLALMVLGVLALFLFYTSARAAWLAVTIEFLLLPLLLARDHFKWKLGPPMAKEKIKALALCAVVGFVLINWTPSGFQWRVGTAYNYVRQALPRLEPFQAMSTSQDTFSIRVRLWRNTLRMGEEHFFKGVGVGNFSLSYPRYARSVTEDLYFTDDGRWRRAHNDYVQTFAELGLVGLFFLGWLIFAFTKTCVALLSKETRGELRYLLMGVMVALGGLSVSAFFSFPFQMITPVFIFMVYLGLLGGHYSRQRLQGDSVAQQKVIIALHSWAAPVGVALTSLFLLVLVPFEYNRLMADWYYRRVDTLAYQKNWAAVISQAKKGYLYYPLRKDFLFHMGSAYLETGNLEASIETTKEFLETHPYYMTAHHNIGLAYARSGDIDPALEHFDRVFELVPEYGESHYVVAQIYELRNEQDKALEHYRLAVDDEGDNAKYRERLARLEQLIEKDRK